MVGLHGTVRAFGLVSHLKTIHSCKMGDRFTESPPGDSAEAAACGRAALAARSVSLILPELSEMSADFFVPIDDLRVSCPSRRRPVPHGPVGTGTLPAGWIPIRGAIAETSR